MYIFNSPSSIRKTITLLLIWGTTSFAFAQEGLPDYDANRGFVEYREVAEAKKGTVIFPVSCEKTNAPRPRKDRLVGLQKKARTYRSRGWKFQSSGDIKRAMKFYKKAIASDPTFAAAYNDLGVIYERKGQLDLAEEYYLKSVNIDPYYLSAYSNLALFYEQKEQFGKAAFFWKRRVELGCTGDAWTEKAKAHLQEIRQYSPEKVDMSDEDEQKILGLIEDALDEADKLQ